MLSKIPLDNTDLNVSQLCYGTNMLGTAMDQGKSSAMLDHFLSLGGNFIDTARSYGDWIPDAPAGASERAIGVWLKGRKRDEVVIATKGGFYDMRMGDYRNRCNPQDVALDLNESLDHLGVEKIDLYWLHMDNPAVPVQSIIDCLIEHQMAGKIGYFGASNWTPDRILEAQAYATSVGHQGFAAVEPFWGLAKPNPEGASALGYNLHYETGFQKLHEAGLPMIPYAGQSRGYFAKVNDVGEEALRDDLKAMYLNDANRKRLEAVRVVAARHNCSISAVVLAYLVCQPFQTIPIIGASSLEQMRESAEAVNVGLDATELEELRGGF